jgi:hypothetical protein
MKRSMKRAILIVPVAVLVFVMGPPTAAPNLGLEAVNLSCSDGTDLGLELDAAKVLQLSDAVSAINLYPAGDPPLTCDLSQLTPTASPLPVSFATPSAWAAEGPKDFAVGGGRFFNQFVGCDENFAINGHAPDDVTGVDTANGTIQMTFPGTPASCTATGHLVAKVDCLDVTGNTADMTGEITKSTGVFTTFGGVFEVGDEIAFEVKDLDPLLPDEIVGQPTNADCIFTANTAPGTFSIIRGNITVHDA